MIARFLIGLVGSLVAALGAATGGERALDAPPAPALSDSALAELAAGRDWHAARILWAEGAAEGTPAEVLLLARAEAGWGNWASVHGLLSGVAWIEDVGQGAGLYLLGRSLEHEGRWAEAAAAYALYSRHVGQSSIEAGAALSRRARALWRAGRTEESLATLEELAGAPAVQSWSAVELALSAAEEGDTAGVRALLVHTVEWPARVATWRAEADGRLNAGDSVGATASFRSLLVNNEGSRRAEVAGELGRLRLAAADTTEARTLLLEAFEGGRGSTAATAAAPLLDLGGFDLDRTLQLARTVDRAGDGARALRAYDRAVSMASVDAVEVPEWARLERARLMATVRPRQDEALEEFRALHETTTDERVGARNLSVWRSMRMRQGLDARATTLRRWLLDEYPGSAEATELAWSEGNNAEARGQLDVALARYAFIADHARTSARAGESRMRSGQIYLRRANLEAAADVFETYLEDFPDGRRWQEAAYWAGRIRLELGDSAVAREHLGRAMREQPVEYYAVMAAELLGVPYRIDVPDGEPPAEPPWLTEGLARLDRLDEAGLERGVEEEIERLKQRALEFRPAALRLAEALIDRGRTIDGINLGWALLDQEGAWDRQLLRVAFPFPYRELVRREAEEWGIDPLLMAAIIRQESAFKADIVSRAGAIGLMQVLPPTGAQLARRHGPSPFSEEALAEPEVNLHLGAAFFVDMSARYGNDLALVLSAYNAGPTRANRWRRYPEVSDPLRFTERIPIMETRGYVKSVRRNLGLYKALYGEE